MSPWIHLQNQKCFHILTESILPSNLTTIKSFETCLWFWICNSLHIQPWNVQCTFNFSSWPVADKKLTMWAPRTHKAHIQIYLSSCPCTNTYLVQCFVQSNNGLYGNLRNFMFSENGKHSNFIDQSLIFILLDGIE